MLKAVSSAHTNNFGCISKGSRNTATESPENRRFKFRQNTNVFKTRFDTFWHNQDIMYGFRAQLEGTEVEVKFRIRKYT